MNRSSNYTDCELEYMSEGFELSMAAEICAGEEGPRPGEESGEANNNGESEFYEDE